MQKMSICWMWNERKVLKCFVGFIVQQNKTCPLFCIWQTDAAGETDFLAYVMSKMKQNLAKDMTLFNTPKQTTANEIWSCFGNAQL